MKNSRLSSNADDVRIAYSHYGGVLFISKTSSVTLQSMKTNNIEGKISGGLFYLEEGSTLSLLSHYSIFSYSSYGSFGFVENDASLNIFNSTITNCYADYSGAIYLQVKLFLFLFLFFFYFYFFFILIFIF